MGKINILGINLNILSRTAVIKKIEEFLKDGKQHYIVTPNPEIVLKAQKDEEYFYIINKADIQLMDGMGLKIAGWMMGKNIPRVTGADIVKDILKFCEEQKIKIAIVNKRGGLSDPEETSKALKNQFPGLDFVIKEFNVNEDMFDYSQFNFFSPKIIFSALGAPYQEKFIYHGLSRMPYAKLCLGIGGAFDFFTRKIKRAPKIFRVLGLEWFWRLINLPFYTDRLSRLKRICAAIFIFPWKFIKWQYFLPFIYRPNVVGLLYKVENNKYYVLIVRRQGEKAHWQLPQGGVDGLSIEKAGTVELNEELNNNRFKPAAVFKNLYKYKFNKAVNMHRAGVIKRHQGYRGQKQSLFIAEFIGEDSDIKVNFWDHDDWKWVESKKLVDSVHPTRQEATKIFLNKFYEAADQKVHLLN
ncbi:MAG: WecB/TagA/CpsF family glycosyltransferase [Patescibacteria group bacterium]|nr:WecB/TagA/CpsF family glycosyltransferase [Patescibacteria group bacterium]